MNEGALLQLPTKTEMANNNTWAEDCFESSGTDDEEEDNELGRWQDPVDDLENNHNRVIVHIDIDCFYAQVEMIRNPSLRDKPLGVKQKSLLVTCNYVARSLGVKKMVSVREAVKQCPELVIVNGEDLTNYREMSYRVTELLHRYTPCVERLGFDENFIDVTQVVQNRLTQQLGDDQPVSVKGHLYANQDTSVDVSGCECGCHQRLVLGSWLAQEMRELIVEEVGLTCCAGVSYNKMLAKLVGEAHKPNQQTTLLPPHAHQLILSLPSPRKIPGIGHSTFKKLEAVLGIHTISQLQEKSVRHLMTAIGNRSVAKNIHGLAHGIDPTAVVASGPPMSISDEDSFWNLCSEVEAKKIMNKLIQSLVVRLTEDGRVPQTLRLSIIRVKGSWHRESRQCPVPPHIFRRNAGGEGGHSQEEVISLLLELTSSLFHKVVEVSKPFQLRLINICFTKLKDKADESKPITSFFLNRHSTLAGSGVGVPVSEPLAAGAVPKATKESSRLERAKEPASSAIAATATAGAATASDNASAIKYEKCDLPPDIDSGVFAALPAEIQWDLLARWEREKHAAGPSSATDAAAKAASNSAAAVVNRKRKNEDSTNKSKSSTAGNIKKFFKKL